MATIAASDGPATGVTWSDPYAPPREVTGVIIQDVPAAEAAKQLVAWLREQKAI